jgi:hypothetical protein
VNSAEGQLEQAIWDALLHHQASTPYPCELLTTLVEVAKAYAAGDSDELTAARRVVLDQAVADGTALAVVRGEGPAAELGPSGSAGPLEVPEGATMSTGGSIPPQACVDNGASR